MVWSAVDPGVEIGGTYVDSYGERRARAYTGALGATESTEEGKIGQFRRIWEPTPVYQIWPWSVEGGWYTPQKIN